MIGWARQFLKRLLTGRLGSLVLHTVERTPLRRLLLNAVYDPESGFMARDDKPAGFCC